MRRRPAPDPPAAAPGPGRGAPAAPALTAQTGLLDQMIPPRTLRRVDHYARMALLASHLAIEDADMGGRLPENAGLVVATGMGPTANTLDRQPADAAEADFALSPILFSNSVQSAAAAYISMLLKIRGPCLSINQYEMSVPLAFQAAIDWLEEGRTETVLVGGIDSFSKALHEAALNGRPSGNAGGARSVAPVGEGSAFFILARSETPGARCPFVHQIHMGTALRPEALPVPNTLVLSDGGNADSRSGPPPAASFAHLYGVFPTSMGMDVAAALALLRRERIPNLPSPRPGGGPKSSDAALIACLKKGEAGDWGMIVVGRDGRSPDGRAIPS